MKFRLAVDIGGTFTDLCVVDEKEEMRSFKSLTTEHLIDGLLDTLYLAGQDYGLSVQELLERSIFFVHGTTVSLNALLERKVAKTGLICTRGFRDILTIREGGKLEPFNWQVDYPKPYIPRYLTLPVTERINAEGEVEIPLDEEEVRQVVRQFRRWNVEAIAVSLLWSIANPVHEKRIGEIVAEEWPGVTWVLSHELNPIIREYRRTSSTVIDASLHKVMSQYLAQLEKALREQGFRGEIFIGTSSGGMMGVEEIAQKPIYTVGSGPTMMPVAGLFFGTLERESQNLLGIDMGGTSFDVSAVRDGQLVLSREAMVGEYMLGISRVDVRSIGAGGGSIAWVDSGGLLHVGPQSAGSHPGPACYDLGGEEPTVTDANVALGYLNPDYFLGGRMRLSPDRSAQVIQEKVADPLRIDLAEAAFSIFTTVNHNMIAAIQDITVKQGVDPRESLLVAGGGAAAIHVVPIAQELRMREVLIPKLAATFSAMGGLLSDIRQEFTGSLFMESHRFDCERVNALLQRLERRGEEFLSRAGVSPEDRKLEYFVEARYPYQVWELEVPLRGTRLSPEGLEALVEGFHRVHEAVFTIKEPGQYIECLYWRVRATGRVPKPEMREQVYGGEDGSRALKGRRRAYFRELGGFVDTPIYAGSLLTYGNRTTGPAIIEEPTTTVVLFPGSQATVSKWGNYLLTLNVSAQLSAVSRQEE